jgi:hypothetical protein
MLKSLDSKDLWLRNTPLKNFAIRFSLQITVQKPSLKALVRIMNMILSAVHIPV